MAPQRFEGSDGYLWSVIRDLLYVLKSAHPPPPPHPCILLYFICIIALTNEFKPFRETQLLMYYEIGVVVAGGKIKQGARAIVRTPVVSRRAARAF